MNDERLLALFEIGRQMTSMGDSYIKAETSKAEGDYEIASEAYSTYLTIARDNLQSQLEFNAKYPDSPYEIPPTVRTMFNVLMVHADVLDSLGRSDEAEANRDEAIELSKQYLGDKGNAEAKRARAASLILQGRFNEAISQLLEARDIILLDDDPISLVRVTIDVADVLNWLGDFSRADEEIVRAERLLQAILAGRKPTSQDVIEGLLTSVSSIMEGQGEPDDALRSVNLYRATTEVVYYHGLIARARSNWDQAERCFNQVLPEYRKLGVAEAIEWQLAQVQMGRGNFGEALIELQHLEPTFERSNFRPKRGVLRRTQAECLLELGQLQKSLERIRESLADLTGQFFDPDALWRSQWVAAKINTAMNNREKALSHYRDAVKTVMSLRRASLGYRLDSKYLEDKIPLYNEAIRTAFDAKAFEDCCQFIESIKSRALAAILSVETTDHMFDSPLAKEFEEVTRSLDSLEYQYYRDGWNHQSWTKHQKLLDKREKLLERIRISDPRWHLLREPITVDFDRLMRELASREQAVMTLYYDPPELITIMITGEGFEGGRLTISEVMNEKLKDFNKNLQKASYDPFKHDLSKFFSINAEQLIPSALLRQGLKAKSLIIVPHGVFHLVPWAGLFYENERLFEILPIGISPNLGFIASEITCDAPQQVGLVGVQSYEHLNKLQDLESVKREITDVRSVYEQRGISIIDPLLDNDATEEGFWNLMNKIERGDNLLHMSCHGVIEPTEPMNSGLLLVDSKVDAAELTRSQLPFREVVLSACSTGWRPSTVDDVILRSDEILGIPAGFLESGVDSVVVSIPKVEGKTGLLFMQKYHGCRADGDTPLNAFQYAQQSMLESGTEPGTWLGFTLYGFI